MAKTAKKAKAVKKAKTPKVAKAAKAVAKKTAKVAKPKAVKSTERRGAPVARTGRISDESVIRLIPEENPRRAGTHAHAHYEKMKGGITVAAYLKKFKPEERRNARQWLTNTIRDGHAKVLGA